jgi:N-acetylmuramoyl-L-alanine amidase
MQGRMKTIKKALIITLTMFLVLSLAIPAGAAALHTVRPGDTLWSIARTYRTTVADLAAANRLQNVNVIYAGQRLTIPTGGSSFYTVRPGDTLWLISQRHQTTVAALLAVNNIPNPDLIEVGQLIRLPQPLGSAVVAARGSAAYSAADLDLFARLVHAEASGESFTGQVAVAASVLNRVKSPLYPNTLRGVIYQVVNGFHQYSPVKDGRINLPANDSARRAVQEALGGADPSRGATGFYNPRKTSNQWVRNQPVTTVIGNHVFFR